MFDFIGIPMGYVLRFLAGLVGNNFAAAVLVFTVLINLLMIPLTVKSQKSSVGQMRIRPKLDELKEKYGDDRQGYSLAMQELYQKENVSMSGGCLPMLLRMVFMMAVYSVINNPLRFMCGVDNGLIKDAIAAKLADTPMKLLAVVQQGGVETIPASALDGVDFTLFGISLTETPSIGNPSLVWIFPFLAFAAQMITSVISMKIQKMQNPDAPNMAGMMLTMPVMSLIIGFSFPAALGFYWAVSALITGAIQTIVSLNYGPAVIIAKEQANDVYARYKKENNRKAN